MYKPYQLLLLPAFVAATLLPANSEARAANETAQSKVSFAGLDLTTNAGVETLYRRLKAASAAVCGPQRSPVEAGSLDRLRENKRCYRQALDQAVSQVNNDRLDELHTGFSSTGIVAARD